MAGLSAQDERREHVDEPPDYTKRADHEKQKNDQHPVPLHGRQRHRVPASRDFHERKESSARRRPVKTRNPAKLVASYKTLGVLLPSADLKLLERAEAQMFDRFWGMSMSELRNVSHAEMRQFAMQFRELMYEMPFQLPHDLLLLGRTIGILSGMCTGLDRDFNVWKQLAPYAQKLVAEEVGSGWQVWLDEVGEVVKQLVALPGQVSRMLDRLERGELGVDIPQIDQQIYYVEAAINRLLGGLIFAVFLFGGVLLVDRGFVTQGYVFWGLSAGALLWTFLTWGHAPRRTRQ